MGDYRDPVLLRLVRWTVYLCGLVVVCAVGALVTGNSFVSYLPAVAVVLLVIFVCWLRFGRNSRGRGRR